MSKEILKGIFEENIAPVREDITFEGWVDKIKDNEEYKVGLFENYVQPSMPDATFEDFNAETFGLGKVEAPLGGAQSEESVSPTESVSSEFEVGPPGVEPKGAPIEEAAALVGEGEPTMMGQKLDPYTIVEEDDRNFFERLFGEERYRRVTERAVETVPALTRLFGKAAAKDVQEEVSDLGRAMDFDPEFVVKASQSGLFTTNNLATYLSQEAAGDKKGAEEINMFLEKGAEGKTTQFQRFKTLYAPIEKERNEAIQKELLSNRDYVALRGKIDAEFNRQRVGVDEKYDFKALVGEEFKVGEKELLDKYESATLALPMQLETKANELKFEYQAKVNNGQISVDEANAGLRRDLDAYGAELQKQSDKALEEYNSGVTALAERLEKGVKDKPEFKAYMDELNELRNGVVESFSNDYQKIQQSVFNNVAPKYNSKIETAITNSMRGETPLLDKSGVKGDIAKIVNNRGWDYLAFDQKRAALNTMFGTALSKLKRSGVEINDGVVANLRAEFDDAFMDRAYFTKKGTPSLFMVKTRAIEEVERLDKMLKEREAKTGTKTYTSGIYGSEFGVGGRGYDDTDVQELRLAREKLQEIIDMPETMSDSEWSNFWNGFTSGQVIDYLPFVSGLKNLSGTLALYRAVGKDTESARYLKNAEALNSTYQNMYEVNNIASDWYKAGKGTAQSLPFMMEFAATAGVGSGVRLGTEKVVVKLLGKQAETVVGKSLKVMAGTLISSLAQTTLNPQRYVDETLKRMTPQMTMAFSPEGDDLVAMLDSSDTEGGFEAALKGFGVTASEYFSEGLGFAGARAMKAVGSKMLQNEFLKRAYVGWYMSKFNFDTPTAFKKIAEMGGWNGFLMEFGEELANIPLTNLITGDAKVMEGIIKDGELDTENLADIARTLLPITLAGGAFSLGTLAISKMSPEGVTIRYRDINNLPATETINKGAWDAVTEVMKSPSKVRAFIANELPRLKVEGKGRAIVTSMLERAAIEFDRGIAGVGTRQIAEATSPLEVTFEPIPETAEAPKVEIIAKRRQKLNKDRTKLVPTGGFDYFAKVGDKEVKLSDAEYKAYKESGVLPESVSAVEVAPEAVAPEAVAPEVEGGVVKGFYTPSKNAQASRLQSSGLPVGKFIALDAPFVSEVHSIEDAQQVEVDLSGKKIYNPNGLNGFPKTEDLSRELGVYANEKIKEGGKTFEEIMTEFYRSKGYDGVVRLIDGGMRNNERELIVFDRDIELKQSTQTLETAEGQPTQAPEAAEGQPAEVVSPEVKTPALRDVESTAKALPNYGKTVDTKMGKVDLVIEPNTESENKNSIRVSAYDANGNTLGFSSAVIDTKNKTLTVKVSQIKDKYQRNGIYSKIIDEYEAIAKDKGLKLEREVEGETQASKDFWNNREKSESLLSKKQEAEGQPTQAPEVAEGQPAEVISPEVAEALSTEDATRIALESLEVLPEGIESAEEGARIYHEAIGKEERTEAEDAIVMAVEDAVIGGAVAPEVAPEVEVPNVEELFESKPELANQVYEALGFVLDIKSMFPVVKMVGKFDASNTGAFFSDIDGTLQLPSNFDSLPKEIQELYLKHEFIHLQIWNKFGKNGFYNNKFSSRLFNISKDLYKKYVDNRVFDNDKLDISKTSKRNREILRDIRKSIKNTEEFFTYAFTDKSFADLLKQEGYYDEIVNWYKENVGETIFPEPTSEQKQQAQELYSQYVAQTGRQDIEGFREFVSKSTPEAVETAEAPKPAEGKEPSDAQMETKIDEVSAPETTETPRPAEGLTSKEKAEKYKKEAEEIAKKIRKNLRGRGGITGITPFSRAKRLAEVDRATLKLIKDYIYQKVLAGAYTFKDFVKDMKENSKRLFGVQIKVFSEDERIFDAGKALFEIDDTFAQKIMKLKDDFISSINNNPSSAGLNFDKFVAANQALVSGFIQAAESQYGLNNTQATSLVRSMYYDAISSVAGTKQSFETIQDIKDFHKKINDAEILNDALDVVRTEDIRRKLNVLSRTWNAFVDAFVSPTRTFDDIFRNVKDRLSLEREVYASRKSRMGSSTKAGNWYNDVHKKIYGGLSWSEIRELNKFLVYRRIREVKQLRDARVIEYNNLEKDLLVPGITDEDKAKIEKRMAELKELGLKRVMSGSVIVNGKRVNFEDYAADYATGIELSDSASATKIKERAKLYTDANNELLKMRLDAGLISQEAYDSMIDKDYVRRVFLDLSASTLDAVSFPSISGQIRAIKSGSEEKFLLMDTQSLLQLSAAVTFSSVDKNRFMQKVAAWTENNQPVFLDKVLDSYKKAFEKKNGRQPTQDEIDKFTKEQTLFMLRRKNQAKPVGFELNTYYVNGKEKILAVRNDLQGVFDTPTGREGVKGRMKGFIDAMSVVNLTGLIKSSAVFYNPAFALKNFGLDLIHASSITTDLYKSFSANIVTILAKATGYTAENVYSKAINGFNSLFARSGRRDSKFDRLVKDYFAHGGGMSSMSAPSTRMYTNSLMSDKLERARSEFVKGGLKFLNALNSFQAGSELITRIIVYEAALNNNIKEYKKKNGIEPTGNDLTSLKESAAASAADLIDFREGTTITKSFDATAFPFLNAMVQGARVSNEFIRKNPGTAMLRLTEFGGMALAIALYNVNSGDEDEKEGIVGYNGISDYMKSNYLVIMMPYTKKNEKGEIVRPYVSLKLTAELKATNIMINGAVSKQGAKNVAEQFAEAIRGGYVPEIGTASPTAQAAFSLAANKDIFKKGAPIYRSREEVLLPDRFNVGETKKIYRDLFKAFYDFGNEDGEDKGILGFDEAGPAQWQAAFEKAISPNNPYYLFLTSTYATVSELAGEKNEREVKALFDEQMSSLNSLTMGLYREPQSSIQQKNIKNKEELEFLEKQIGSWKKKNDDLITAVVAKKLRDIDNNPDLAMREYDMLNFFQSDIFNYISDKEIERTVKAQGIKKLPEDFNRIIDFVVKEESRMMLKLYEEFKPNSISKYPSLKNYKEVKKGILELEQRTEAIEAMRDEYLTLPSNKRIEFLISLTFVAGDDFEDIVSLMGVDEESYDNYSEILESAEADAFKEQFLRTEDKYGQVSSEPALNKMLLIMELMKNK